MPNWYNLLTPEGVTAYMAESVSSKDWNERARIVRSANRNRFPAFWHTSIINSGLSARTASNWGKENGTLCPTLN
jgi:hypothetical protein